MATLTDSGEYCIYHRDEYGGPWFYAPADWDYPEAFSAGYLGREAALDAALNWEEEMLAEGRREIEEEQA